MTNQSRLNIPNALSAIRLIGSFVLIAVALAQGPPGLVLGVFLLLACTDWIDGKLAVWLQQRTSFGARLDSVADAAMYGALLFACIWIKSGVLLAEAFWILAALGMYLISCTAAAVKFRRLPSYHTYSAKTAWMLTVIATVFLLTGWAVWPLRVAMAAVALANLEAVLITLLSDRWQADVPTLWHAVRRR